MLDKELKNNMMHLFQPPSSKGADMAVRIGPHRQALGFTLIEALVVISILGILFSLAAVAVQSSRETARRATCNSNLRQLSLAVSNYESIHGVFPPGLTDDGSFYISILPQVERSDLFEDFRDFRENGGDPFRYSPPSIALFQCPSDPADAARPGANYAGCTGTWLLSDGWNGVFRYWVVDTAHPIGPVTTAHVTDGLSNTIALGEILRGDGSFGRLRTNWNTQRTYSNMASFADACRAAPANPRHQGWVGDPWTRGTPWTDGNMGATLYNHALTPNNPSCYNHSGVADGLSTAASLHNKGVNVAFADGHISFLDDSINQKVWRALASRAGRD